MASNTVAKCGAADAAVAGEALRAPLQPCRILFLCARFPWQRDTGAKIRTFYLLRGLAQVHAVTCVGFAAPQEASERQLSALLPQVRHWVSVPHARLDGIHFGAAYRSVRRATAYAVEKYYSAAMQRTVTALLTPPRRFDVVHCEHLHMAQYLLPHGSGPAGHALLLNEHNIESALWDGMAAQAGPLARIFFNLQAERMRRYEVAMCRRAQVVVTCSAADQEWVEQQAGPRRVAVVPNGVDVEYFHPRLGAGVLVDPNVVIFVGSLDWFPNKQGVLRFCAHVWPLLRRRRPQTRLWVVGRHPDAQVRALPKQDTHISVMADVADVRPWLARAAVVVVPLWMGSGTRLKILEAWAMGKCVVATPVGAAGLACSHGDNILLASESDAAGFAEQLYGALQQPERAAALGSRARCGVVAHYDWRMIGRTLAALASSVAPAPD